MSALILTFGDRKLLLGKPDSFLDLVKSARGSFSIEAKQPISFHFKPEWYDGEVELTSSGFDHVHDRAIVRTSVDTAPPQPEQTVKNPYQASNGPMMAGRGPPRLGNSAQYPPSAPPSETQETELLEREAPEKVFPETISICILNKNKKLGSAIIMVKSAMIVGELKRRVCQLFSHEMRNSTGLSISHDDLLMDDDNRPITDYGVRDDSRIYFMAMKR